MREEIRVGCGPRVDLYKPFYSRVVRDLEDVDEKPAAFYNATGFDRNQIGFW